MKIIKKFSLAIAVILIVFILVGLNSNLNIVEYNIDDDKVSDNIKVVLLTDLHSCKYGENQTELIDAINLQNPDLILLSGDIYDDVLPRENTSILLEAIGNKYPCYYVTGNHEYWSNDIESIIGLVEGYGVTNLNGDSVTVDIKGQKIDVLGVTDPDVVKYVGNSQSFEEQLDNLDYVYNGENYSILLSHRPEKIEDYKNYNFDLVLSGHAHGGQWRIPYLLNGLVAPNQGLFPKYAGGEYNFNNTKMIVSRGLARESTIVPRFYNRPELIVININ